MSATDPTKPEDVHEEPLDGPVADVQPTPPRYECPHCGQEVEGEPQPLSPFCVCSHCGMQFAVAVELPPTDDPAEQDARDRKHACEDELSELRIKQLSRHRRAIIRGRSHLLVGFVIFAGACAKLIQMGVKEILRSQHLNLRAVGLLLFATAAVIPANYFLRRARQITRDLKKPMLQDPPTPPDFSTLQDGSQHSKNLENMQ
jgi:hypothetical protein